MKKNLGRTLLMAALALSIVLSVTGGTIAWFTDTVESTGNIIKSGTLDVEMNWADGKSDPAATEWTDASQGAIFNYDLWEPGYTQVRHIQIKNAGTLALKYQLQLTADGEVSKLADVIDVYFIDPAQQIAARTDLPAAPIGNLTSALAAMPGNTAGSLEAGETAMVTIALKMQESAGNDYQGLSIGSSFSLKLLATQDTVENDSFGSDYDGDAEYPGPVKVDDSATLKDALLSESDVIMVDNFSLDGQVVMTAGTIDGNGKTISYGAANPNYPGFIITEGKVQNLTIDRSGRGYAAFGATSEHPINGDVALDNVTVAVSGNVNFGFNTSLRFFGNESGTLRVSDSSLEGNIDLVNLEKATFENTKIVNRKNLTGSSATGGICILALNCDTDFTNCQLTTVLNPIKISPDIQNAGTKRVIRFTDCTYNGTAITASNLWSNLLSLTVANKSFSKAEYNASYIFYVNDVLVTL